MADQERQVLQEGMTEDPNAGLLSVASTYWITYCAYKLIKKFTKIDSPHLTLEVMTTDTFKNSLRKYAKKAAEMFYDAAIDSYERETYGSFKSTLRSTKFLHRIESKINLRLTKIDLKSLPDLAVVGKNVKKTA